MIIGATVLLCLLLAGVLSVKTTLAILLGLLAVRFMFHFDT